MNRRSLTLVEQLTLWYSGVLGLSLMVVFASVYFLVKADIRREDDGERVTRARELIYVQEAGGLDALFQEILRETRAEGTSDVFIRILDATGKEVRSSDVSTWPQVGVNVDLLNRAANGGPLFETVKVKGRQFPARVLYFRLADNLVIQLGQSLAPEKEAIARFKRSFFLASLAVVALATLLGAMMIGNAMSRVAAITQTALSISDKNLSSRVPLGGRKDELDNLASAFNRMLDRIEGLVGGMRKMIDDLAHELRTPITRLRGAAELSLTADSSLADYQNLAANVVEEVDRLLSLVNMMLDISEAEAGVANVHPVQIDLAAMLRETCELMNPLAEDKHVGLHLAVPQRCPINGEVGKLQRAFSNIIDNAIKYTPLGGSVHVTLREGSSEVEAVIQDTGSGIAPEDLPHIFDRFYRGRSANRASGFGLGLSLTRAVINAHGGNVVVKSALSQGTSVVVTLPAAAVLNAFGPKSGYTIE